MGCVRQRIDCKPSRPLSVRYHEHFSQIVVAYRCGIAPRRCDYRFFGVCTYLPLCEARARDHGNMRSRCREADTPVFQYSTGALLRIFHRRANMHKNIFEPHSKPSEIDLASIKIASRTNTLDISDYGEFAFDVHPEEEFQPAGLVVSSIASNRVWYLNLKSGM